MYPIIDRIYEHIATLLLHNELQITTAKGPDTLLDILGYEKFDLYGIGRVPREENKGIEINFVAKEKSFIKHDITFVRFHDHCYYSIGSMSIEPLLP